MADDGEIDKSEQATSFKLQKARDRGQIARGTDLSLAVVLAVVVIYAWVMADSFIAVLAQAMRHSFLTAGAVLPNVSSLAAAISQSFAPVLYPFMVLALSTMLAVLVFEFIQAGPVFSAHPLKPDFSRLNPAKGLKRLFTMRLLVDTGKSILKLALYTAAVYFALHIMFRNNFGAITDARSLASEIGIVSFRLAVAFLVVAILLSVLDQLYVRRDFAKKMRMSRREIRREMRDREGEPRQKQNRKRMHGEFVKMSRSLRGLRDADVLLVNPVHFAVALRYRREELDAPVVVAAASHRAAKRLRGLAITYNIPVVEDPALARALFRKTRLDAAIGEEFFDRVAKIYNGLTNKSQTL